ncbi:MAG TPA: amidohydrolase family protein [Isosphaeraceae bacterium]|jgi:imidazolonepropionase-like amidohydrolase|nr:amidohydrolase family protein [Isosphaeraceae bacterium]
MAADWRTRALRLLALILATTATVASAWPREGAARDDDPRPGYRPAAFAIKGAKVVVSPDAKATIENGTVILRDGLIEEVGPADQVAIPFDAETIDGKGLVVYAGFLDLDTTLGAPPAGVQKSRTGPSAPLKYSDYALARTPEDDRNGITPEYEVAAAIDLAENVARERRALGFTALVAAPGGGIATGQSALISLGGRPRRESILRTPVALQIALRSPTPTPQPPGPDEPPAVARRRFQGMTITYPTSLMGIVAHLRQAMLDAEYDQAISTEYPTARRPFDPALKALHAARTKALPVWWEANTRDEIHRVLDLAAEFGTTAVIVGGSESGKVVDRLKAEKVPVVLRLDFPDEPKAATAAEYRKQSPAERGEPLRVQADRVARWRERVGSAKSLAAAGVPFAFATEGLSRLDAFPTHLRQMIAAGLKREDALDALTRRAAEIAGVADRLGTIEKGKLGHLVVLSAPLGDERARVRYVFVDGQKFDKFDAGPESPRGSRARARSEPAKKDEPSKKAEPAKKDEPPKKAEPARKDESTKKDDPAKKDEPAKPDQAKKAETAPKAEAAKAEPPKAELKAEASRKDETPKAEVAKKADATPATPKADVARKADATPATPKDDPAAAKGATRPDVAQAKSAAATAPPKGEEDQPPSTSFVDVATELDEDRKPTLKTGGDVFIKDATILTVTKGTIPKGSILVRKGKIEDVGPDLKAPEGVKVLDATGLVALPGIIDTHSHMAIQGGVNEMSLSIVPEVRVRDVVNGDDPTIFRALAGGVTTARLLHGSADTIGGQDAVIKLRQGLPARELLIKDAPQGVKFALGENVTRRTGRFPNTRMGVEATIEEAFEEGRAYKAEWDAYTAAKAEGKPARPPRRDLRLEAIAGILDGSLKIHCHCYRSDEILMLMRVAARHGVRVQSLQHVLEGYKVAPEIAEHGASCSTFSDWWAYKVEAFDAIPYNSALLTEAGVAVCIKSDDEELVRHLDLEAAKMMKYGGVPEAQALAMITINPARQLGIDGRLGSIEKGKDADIALYNGHPFDAFSRVELTLIDGEVYFQRREPGGKPASRGVEHATVPVAAEELRRTPFVLPGDLDPHATLALTAATIHTVSKGDIKEGTIVVGDGKILAVGGPETAVPQGARVIEARGLDVWPGLIDAGSVTGLFEVGSLAETQDHADSATFQPDLATSTALHPDSELIPVARANGILAAYIQPDGGTIAGQGCVIALNGWVPAEMILADRAALNINIPSYVNPEARRRGRFAGAGGDPNARRKELIDGIREQFRAALAYDRVMAAARAQKGRMPRPDPRLAALAPYARGERPVIFRAERRVEILDAIDLAEELKLKAMITGGLEAWKVVDRLKAAKVPVLLAGTHRLPGDPTDPYDAPYATPARLYEAGVTFAIRSAGFGPETATASRNLPYEAATAVAFGLPEAEALKAVTLTPARLLGLGDQLGSLDVGKRADLVITAGHVLQPTTEVKALVVGGRPIAPESRHTQLYSKYRRRLAEVRAGTSRLGLDRVATTPAAGTGNGAAPAPAPSTTPAPATPGAAEKR